MTSCDLDADIDRVLVEVRNQHFADHRIEEVFLGPDGFDARRERTNQTIGEEHAEECADERASDRSSRGAGPR